MKIKTLFFGTPDFARNILEHLLTLNFLEICGVVTQPDKLIGRKRILTESAVKRFARERNLIIFSPEKLSLVSEDILKKINPELIIVAAYGKILKSNILNYPKYRCLNIHGSLLPKLRGATPIQSAILQGLDETGVTLQAMNEGIDTGEIIGQEILQNVDLLTINTPDLFMQLSELSKKLIDENLRDYLEGKVVLKKQDDNMASYCTLSDFSYEKAEILPEKETVEEIYRKVRAFYGEPGAWIKYKYLNLNRLSIIEQDLTLKIYETALVRNGERKKNKLYLEGKDNLYLELKTVQKAGGKLISGESFLNGFANR